MDLLALNRIIQDNTPSTSTTTPSTFTPAHIGAPTSSTSSRDEESKTETDEIWKPEELPDKIDLIGNEDETRKRPHFDILYKMHIL